jgi:hypothetical protein
MPLQQITVPDLDTYSFGVGVDRLSGTAMNLAVNPTPSGPVQAQGSTGSFAVSRVTTTNDLQAKLGIGVDASYGLGSFGLGISGRFSFVQQSAVHSASLFMAITADVHLADLSIPECVLTPAAQAMVDKPDLFAQRYGDMFVRACRRGGLFVGIMQVETFDEEESTSIEAELKGSYGLFSADAVANFHKVTTDHRTSVYCTLYYEGGPAVHIDDPTDPKEMLNAANAWMEAIQAQPDQYSVPYQWTLSPLSIAEGPLPPNAAQIENAQQIVKFCAEEQAALLDQFNLLNWWIKHPEHYDWTGTATLQQVTQAANGTQVDLDTVAACASVAIGSPELAKRPADYALANGIAYPAGQMPAVPPRSLPGPVMIFDKPSYTGNSQILQVGTYDAGLGQITIGNDAIQSLQVPADLVVRLYEHFHFQGQFIDIHQDTDNLNTWDSKASSLIVYKKGDPPPRTTIVVLVELPNNDTWDGPFWIFSAENGMQSQPNMKIRSGLIPAGMVVTLFSGPGFTGTSTDFTQDTADLGDNEPGGYSFIVWDQQQGMPPH